LNDAASVANNIGNNAASWERRHPYDERVFLCERNVTTIWRGGGSTTEARGIPHERLVISHGQLERGLVGGSDGVFTMNIVLITGYADGIINGSWRGGVWLACSATLTGGSRRQRQRQLPCLQNNIGGPSWADGVRR
jgi:hypothetical protein